MSVCPLEAVRTLRCPYVPYVPLEAVRTLRCLYVPYVPLEAVRTVRCLYVPYVPWKLFIHRDVRMSLMSLGSCSYTEMSICPLTVTVLGT